jgi:quercetin dioxygenase-like cupin family protein
MHYFKRQSQITKKAHPVFEGHSLGYLQTPLIDHTSGSVHTGLSLCELSPGGEVAPHVHSFEEGFYLLEGDAEISVNEEVYSLRAGDFGVAKVGWTHSWRNAGNGPATWLQMAAPQPKPVGKERDTFFVRNGKFPGGAKPAPLARACFSSG